MKKITETALLAGIGTLPNLSSLLGKTLEHAFKAQRSSSTDSPEPAMQSFRIAGVPGSMGNLLHLMR